MVTIQEIILDSCTELNTEILADNQMLKWEMRVLALDQPPFGGLFIILYPDNTARNRPGGLPL